MSDKTKYVEKEKEMKLYNQMHSIASHRNYIVDEEIGESYTKGFNINGCGLAEYIHNNLDGMDCNEKRLLLSRCLTPRRVECELLKYELKYYTEPSMGLLTLDQFEKKAKVLLKRYQWKAGGFYIEDIDWIAHRKGSKYRLYGNQLVLENTMDSIDGQDTNFLQFMKKIVNRLNNIAPNISVSIKYDISKEDSLTWIILKCTDTSKMEKKIEL